MWAAVFLYDISVATGQFEIMKESVAAVAANQRLQGVLHGVVLAHLLKALPDSRYRGRPDDWAGLPAVPTPRR